MYSNRAVFDPEKEYVIHFTFQQLLQSKLTQIRLMSTTLDYLTNSHAFGQQCF